MIRRPQLIEELKLLAAGANGGEVMLDDQEFHCLQSAMYPAAFGRFAASVKDRYFTDAESGKWEETFGLFGIVDIEKWTDFETLADAILAERQRLDQVKKKQTGAK